MGRRDDDGRVLAAGGVVWRPAAAEQGVEVLVVHRPRYDDWSLPKGKLDEGESFEDAALREVWEETGLLCRLGDEVAPAEYVDGKGRPKLVRYWAMTVRKGKFRVNDEVDEARWMSPERAARRLTYAHDEQVLASALSVVDG
ncbi:MAG: NUDIX hydrolase [Acidimicrobiia bacterium]|nr:NUDIX hydrolase [Acidimicrobiia bacterium]